MTAGEAGLTGWPTAYGDGADADRHLRAFAGGTDREVEQALLFMESAVVNEGVPFPVAGPIAAALPGLLADPATAGARAEVLDLVGLLAEAADQFDTSADELAKVAAPDGRDVLAEYRTLLAERSADAREPVDVLLDDDAAANALVALGVAGIAQAAPALVTAVGQFADDPDDEIALPARRAAEALTSLLDGLDGLG